MVPCEAAAPPAKIVHVAFFCCISQKEQHKQYQFP
jgi:hypothetical protein